ncbi:MAG TPA: archease [Longimicrobiales bacterium]|nr:archease [Longimicrobiales bacterium]
MGSDARHELVDHTSEVTMRLRAPTFPALVAEATRAFAELVPPHARGARSDGWRELRVGGLDREAALVAWLNEIVYLCEVDRWLPEEAEVSVENGGQLRVRVRGVALVEPFVLVKAATLHGAEIRAANGGLEVEVTLDI